MSNWRLVAARIDWGWVIVFSLIVTFTDVLGGEQRWQEAARRLPLSLWICSLGSFVLTGGSGSVLLFPSRILQENDRAVPLLFLLFSMLALWIQRIVAVPQVLYVALICPTIVCLSIWAFERLVPRPLLAPYHRLALALLALPILFFAFNAF